MTTCASRRRRRRGLSLAFVLVVAALTSTVAFAMAAVTTSHLRMAQQHANGLDALYLAETAIAQTVAAIHANRDFGVTRNDAVTYRPDPADDSRSGVVTFRSAGSLYATNNVGGSGAAAGCDGPATVAAGTVQIVATGRSRGLERVVEATLAIPAFPYVMAAAGGLEADALVVAGASSLQELYQAAQAGKTLQKPADLAANASLKVTQSCEVSGDLLTLQVLGLPSGDKLRVGGAIRTAAADLPDLPLAQFDPSNDPTAVVLNQSQYAGLTVEPGTFLAQPPSGTLTVAGDLTLDRGVMYVKGNVEIQGGVKGRGAVIAEGDAIIKGGADLSSDSMLALLCGGKASMAGSGPAKYFQGMVYARGGLEASNLTVAGTTIVGAAGGGGGVKLSTASLVHLPEAAQLEFDTTQSSTVESAFPLGLVVFLKPGATSPQKQEVLQAYEGALQGTPFKVNIEEKSEGSAVAYLSAATAPLPDGDRLALLVVRGGTKDGNHMKVNESSTRFASRWPKGGGPPQNLQPDEAEALLAAMGLTFDAMEARMRDGQERAVAKSNELVDRANTETVTHKVHYDFSVNQFLRDTMPVRIVSWRER